MLLFDYIFKFSLFIWLPTYNLKLNFYILFLFRGTIVSIRSAHILLIYGLQIYYDNSYQNIRTHRKLKKIFHKQIWFLFLVTRQKVSSEIIFLLYNIACIFLICKKIFTRFFTIKNQIKLVCYIMWDYK